MIVNRINRLNKDMYIGYPIKGSPSFGVIPEIASREEGILLNLHLMQLELEYLAMRNMYYHKLYTHKHAYHTGNIGIYN